MKVLHVSPSFYPSKAYGEQYAFPRRKSAVAEHQDSPRYMPELVEWAFAGTSRVTGITPPSHSCRDACKSGAKRRGVPTPLYRNPFLATFRRKNAISDVGPVT
jgi:hypothetical protein